MKIVSYLLLSFALLAGISACEEKQPITPGSGSQSGTTVNNPNYTPPPSTPLSNAVVSWKYQGTNYEASGNLSAGATKYAQLDTTDTKSSLGVIFSISAINNSPTFVNQIIFKVMNFDGVVGKTYSIATTSVYQFGPGTGSTFLVGASEGRFILTKFDGVNVEGTFEVDPFSAAAGSVTQGNVKGRVL